MILEVASWLSDGLPLMSSNLITLSVASVLLIMTGVLLIAIRSRIGVFWRHGGEVVRMVRDLGRELFVSLLAAGVVAALR